MSFNTETVAKQCTSFWEWTCPWCLLVNRITEKKTTGPILETWWKGVAQANEEPITFWIGSKSRPDPRMKLHWMQHLMSVKYTLGRVGYLSPQERWSYKIKSATARLKRLILHSGKQASYHTRASVKPCSDNALPLGGSRGYNKLIDYTCVTCAHRTCAATSLLLLVGIPPRIWLLVKLLNRFCPKLPS